MDDNSVVRMDVSSIIRKDDGAVVCMDDGTVIRTVTRVGGRENADGQIEPDLLIDAGSLLTDARSQDYAPRISWFRDLRNLHGIFKRRGEQQRVGG